METAILAGGCFWCTEAIFERLKGVKSVRPGYSGGDINNASYAKISAGNTGHAESVKIEFNPKIISYKTLLRVFFKLHDPTTLNQQGEDIGPQYRSAIFYIDERQKKIAEEERTKIPNAVTEIKKFSNFFEAEDYHKDYYEKNKEASYCRLVIDPKIKKLYREFSDLAIKK